VPQLGHGVTFAARRGTRRPGRRAWGSDNPYLQQASGHALFIGREKAGELQVKLRVTENPQLELELLARKLNVFSKTFSLLKGTNALIARSGWKY
jgi:hypothetical protein